VVTLEEGVEIVIAAEAVLESARSAQTVSLRHAAPRG
jgi:hypothetical protein